MKKALLLFLSMFSITVYGQFNCQSTKHAPASMQMTAPIDYNSRSDTADLVQLKLTIDSRDFANGQLTGIAEYQLGAKLPFSSLRFDLLGFTVDSIISLSGSLNFSQQGEHVVVNASAVAGQILQWTFHYHGSTTKDASGWGGIHHDGAYHYNLGVGFAANPHVYGRSLFPCFDNFVEKSTLDEMNIITTSGKVGVSNGIYVGTDTLSNGDLVWRWEGQAPIPSYLVSMAVSDYFKQSWTHDGRPFEIYGRAQDTANMTAGFVHLNDIYDAFVEEFGPYRFEKVGYALTITGAMEHAGMVHLPRTLANANLNGEDIIAHELAHMWFGNAITTKTAEDMWINEGFAEFGSHLYEEKVYSRSKYVQTVQNNQALVLKQAAQSDGGHLALSGVNQNQTYGTHTYQKGAMVAHNLREFLGDSLFSHAVKQLIATNTFGNYNANTFKESFENSTGVDLDDFWNDWIYNPGYHGIHAELTYGNNTNWASNQKSVQLHHLSAHLPSTYGSSQNTTPVNIYKHSYNNGYLGKVSLGTSENFPATSANGTYHTGQADLGTGSDYWISVNDSAESLGTSVYDSFKWSDLNGTTTLPRTGVKITPASTNNGLHGTFYVWHHIVEGLHPDGVTTSKDHFYFIGYEGAHDPPVSFNTALPFEVTLQYNTNANNGGLDADLKGQPGNQMTVGQSNSMRWMTGSVMSGVSNQTLGNFGIGNLSFTPQHLARYYFIMNTSNIGMDEQNGNGLKLYPNPSEGRLKIETNLGSAQLQYEINDMNGKLVDQGSLDHANGTSELSLSKEISPGTYLFRCEAGTEKFSVR
jgi:aminopeptidase N